MLSNASEPVAVPNKIKVNNKPNRNKPPSLAEAQAAAQLRGADLADDYCAPYVAYELGNLKKAVVRLHCPGYY